MSVSAGCTVARDAHFLGLFHAHMPHGGSAVTAVTAVRGGGSFSTVEAMGGRSMDYISIGNNLSHGILVTTDVGTASGLGVVHSIDRALLSASQMPNTTSTTAIPPGSAGSESETTMTSETIILLAIGALLCLLLVILAGMAVCCRGGSGSSSQPVVVAQQHGYGGPSPVGIYRGQPQQERMQSPHHREPPMVYPSPPSLQDLGFKLLPVSRPTGLVDQTPPFSPLPRATAPRLRIDVLSAHRMLSGSCNPMARFFFRVGSPAAAPRV